MLDLTAFWNLACSRLEKAEFQAKAKNAGNFQLSLCCIQPNLHISFFICSSPILLFPHPVFLACRNTFYRRCFAADADYSTAACEKVLLKVAP
jgi:hypothetical protein